VVIENLLFGKSLWIGTWIGSWIGMSLPLRVGFSLSFGWNNIILSDGTHYPYGWNWIGTALSFRMEIIILTDGTLLELRAILVLRPL